MANVLTTDRGRRQPEVDPVVCSERLFLMPRLNCLGLNRSSGAFLAPHIHSLTQGWAVIWPEGATLDIKILVKGPPRWCRKLNTPQRGSEVS